MNVGNFRDSTINHKPKPVLRQTHQSNIRAPSDDAPNHRSLTATSPLPPSPEEDHPLWACSNLCTVQGFGGDPRIQKSRPQYSNCVDQRKALLIGINYFGQHGQLQSCITNSRNMASYLVEIHGYRHENIVILTDDQQSPISQPTRRNVLLAMHWLVKSARPRDSLFFYYSGHAGQSECVDSSDSDGRDETIYPVDFRHHGNIRDKELYRIMVDSSVAGVRLVSIIDSYHPVMGPDLPHVYFSEGLLR